jgi:hypothetical protein
VSLRSARRRDDDLEGYYADKGSKSGQVKSDLSLQARAIGICILVCMLPLGQHTRYNGHVQALKSAALGICNLMLENTISKHDLP